MSEVTARLKTAIADRYQIERELGQGGMATVYLAHDMKHDRKVALKVLRPELAAVIGAERFLQEIKVTANLQHSHILPLYDSGAAEGFLYYVMPYVEGETLRTRLQKEKQLGVDEAVAIARAIAAALEHAHKQGVIHRDIKPENILLRDDDPLIADFGIALALSHAGGSRLTETGLSIGTPHYMSPEQAMGDREMDARSDVYSLGAMLFEMLAGDPPYTGSTAQAIVAKVITEKAPSVTMLRDTVPPHVAGAIAKALNKLPADRFHSAAEFADALARPGVVDTAAYATAAAPSSRQRPPSMLPWAGWAAAGVLAVIAGWQVLSPDAVRPVARYSIQLPPGHRLGSERGTRIALAPDGSRLAYLGSAQEASGVWLQRRDGLAATPLPGTAGATHLFFSPDGSRIGYTAAGQQIYTVSLSGGPPSLVTDSLVGLDGSTWSADGYLYFDGFTGGGTEGIRRVPAEGGLTEVVTTVDTATGETDHIWPTALPDGRGVLFVVTRGGGQSASDIAVVAPGDVPHRVLVRGMAATYAAGHLLYVVADGSLMAAPFDLGRLEVTGDAIAIGTSVGVRAFGATDLTASAEGTVLYQTGLQGSDPDEVVWVTRDGVVEVVDPEWGGDFETVALSPDGRRLAMSITTDGEQHLWMKELPRGPLTKLSFEGTINYRASWRPDGRRLTFTSNAGGLNRLLEVRAEGGTVPEVRLALGGESVQEGIWAPDGSLVFRGGGRDLLHLRRDGDTVRLTSTPFWERGPSLSPDGRWIAYQSDESGRYEVYVRPFPNMEQGRWQVSSGGGITPCWSRDGRELFYLSPTQMVAAEVVRSTGTFTLGARRPLFPRTLFAATAEFSYDVAADGRFIGIRAKDGGASGELVLIQNVGAAIGPARP